MAQTSARIALLLLYDSGLIITKNACDEALSHSVHVCYPIGLAGMVGRIKDVIVNEGLYITVSQVCEHIGR